MARWSPTSPKLVDTKAELARLVGCRIETLARWMQEEDFPRAAAGGWSVFEVCEWKVLRDHKAEAAKFDLRALDDDDDDAALERQIGTPDAREQAARIKWTEERARLAEQKRLEGDRQLCSRETIHEGFTKFASVIRSAAEAIQRQHGPGSADILNEALESVAAEYEGLVGQKAEADGE